MAINQCQEIVAGLANILVTSRGAIAASFIQLACKMDMPLHTNLVGPWAEKLRTSENWNLTPWAAMFFLGEVQGGSAESKQLPPFQKMWQIWCDTSWGRCFADAVAHQRLIVCCCWQRLKVAAIVEPSCHWRQLSGPKRSKNLQYDSWSLDIFAIICLILSDLWTISGWITLTTGPTLSIWAPRGAAVESPQDAPCPTK